MKMSLRTNGIHGKGVKGMRKMLCLLLPLLVLTTNSVVAFAGIENSPHDLSANSTGDDIKSSETELCIFCHTPHNAVQKNPLWNRTGATNVTFTLYSNLDNPLEGDSAGELSASTSYMCLTCHDGTTALNSYGKNEDGTAPDSTNSTVAGTGVTAAGVLSSKAALGTNLSDDHPINIKYMSASMTDGDPDIKDNPSGVKLFGGSVQCGSCHDVHDWDTNGQFLRLSKTQSGICFACHDK